MDIDRLTFFASTCSEEEVKLRVPDLYKDPEETREQCIKKGLLSEGEMCTYGHYLKLRCKARWEYAMTMMVMGYETKNKKEQS